MLSQKKILITGSTSGIGRETAKVIASYGGYVIINGRSNKRAMELQEEIGSNNSSIYLFDITDRNAVSDFIQDCPKLDGIIHCAGINRIIPFGFVKFEAMYEMFNINYFAPIMLTQQIFKKKKFNENASIVFISSIMSIVGEGGNTVYAGTKSALVGSVRCIALELAKRKIRVNCISPGFIRTSMTDSEIEINEDEAKNVISLHPLGEGMAKDVANLCVFLCSDNSRWITGQNIIIDGGYSTQ